jgi:hypothetical protein
MTMFQTGAYLSRTYLSNVYLLCNMGSLRSRRASAIPEHTLLRPDTVLERQKRCYLVGRMSNKDALARQLAQELCEKAARFQVLTSDQAEVA